MADPNGEAEVDWDELAYDPVEASPPGADEEGDEDDDALFSAIRGGSGGGETPSSLFSDGDDAPPASGASGASGPERLSGAQAPQFPPVWAEAPLYQGRGYYARLWKYRHGVRSVIKDRAPINVSTQYLAEGWGPGMYDVEVFEADGTIHTSETITIDRDHEVFSEARHRDYEDAPVQGAPYPSMAPPEGIWGFLSASKEADARREESLSERLAEREQRADEEVGRLADMRVGLAEKFVDSQTEFMRSQMEQARMDRETWAQRETAQAANSAKVLTDGMGMIMQMQSENLQLQRDRMDREERRREAERERREKAAREERLERDQLEARRESERLAREERRERELREFQRERMDLQKQMFEMQLQMVAQKKDPLSALAPYGAMIAGSLPILERLGLLDGIKERLQSVLKPKEPETDWMGLIKSAIENGSEAFQSWAEARAAMEEFEDDIPMLPDYEGLEQVIHPKTGNVLYVDVQTSQVYTPEQVQQAQVRGEGGGEVAETGPPETTNAPAPELTPEQEQAFREQQAAAESLAHAAALGRDVGGPAVMALSGFKSAQAPEDSESGAEDEAESEGSGWFTPSQQQAIAQVPSAHRRKARKIMRLLVKKIRDSGPDDWPKWTRAAVMKGPTEMSSYLKAATIRRAALEAGAQPGLVDRYLDALARFKGPDAAFLEGIPTE